MKALIAVFEDGTVVVREKATFEWEDIEKIAEDGEDLSSKLNGGTKIHTRYELEIPLDVELSVVHSFIRDVTGKFKITYITDLEKSPHVDMRN